MKAAKVYVNGRLIGFHKEPLKLLTIIKEKRRTNQINFQVNIRYDEETNEIYINTDAGRIQRPLIVVENGKPKLKEEHIQKLKKGELTWNDLVKQGIIEYLDPDEEENAKIALTEEELTKEHTHLEISPIAIFSIATSLIPYLEHNLAGRNLHGAKMVKQAIGIPSLAYNLRMDTESYLLHYPQKPIVKTKTFDILNLDERPFLQNFVVAIIPFYGYNMQDAIVINRGSIERGLGRISYFRVYEAEELKYPGGQKDNFELPDEETDGYLGEDAYQSITEDGTPEVETYISPGQVVIGKTSPPRFLEEVTEFGVISERKVDNSIVIEKDKPGWVDKVFITESSTGTRLVKVKIRTTKNIVVGDKLSSRHGQKGVVGAIFDEEDIPISSSGIRPDLIFNPHSVPSRMTVGHLLEMLAGKVGSLKGEQIDGTAYSGVTEEELKKMLKKYGFRYDGKEVFYDGTTGERMKGEIYTGVISYQRLWHLVDHKIQARARGPVQILTRQPTEGKKREGGLKFGEMEAETLIGHGASLLLNEKLLDDADKIVVPVCAKCGVIAIDDKHKGRKYCPVCKGTEIYDVSIPYSFKLLVDYLLSLGVFPKLVVKSKK